MKMNPDCIREILLYIESQTDSEIDSVCFSDLVGNMTGYTENIIHYHVNLISKANLVDNVFYCDNMPDEISDLSVEGHEFLANIRSTSNWCKIKEISKKVGTSSLDALKQISIGVISELIKNQFIS